MWWLCDLEGKVAGALTLRTHRAPGLDDQCVRSILLVDFLLLYFHFGLFPMFRNDQANGRLSMVN